MLSPTPGTKVPSKSSGKPLENLTLQMDFIWLLLGLLLCLLSIKIINIYRAAALFPPGPTPLPFIGNLYAIQFQLHHKKLMKLSKIYGNIITVWAGQTPMIVLNGYETVRQCLTSNSEQLANRPTTPFFKYYSEERGIIFSNGHNWKLQRRLGLKILRNLGLGKKNLEWRIKGEAHNLVDMFLAQKGRAIDPKQCIINAVSNVTYAVLFGHTFSLKDEIFCSIVDASSVVTNFFGTPWGQVYDIFPWLLHHLPGPQQTVYKALHFMKQYIRQEIKQHQQNPSSEPQDVVDYYLEYISKAQDDPSSTINEDNMIQLLLDFQLAGTETTTSALQWALLFLAVHQDIQVKVQKELDAFVQSTENLQYEDRLSLPYTNAVIHEIQRFSTVAPMGLPRQCTKDIEFHGYLIKKGTIIIANLDSVHMDPKQWKFPETFNPSNFLDEDGNFQSNEAFLPFSIGHRVCLGEQLARMELFIFLTTLLKTLSFHLPQGVTEVNMDGIFGPPLRPHPYEICAIPR
ncbi:cytochrome P450 2J5-like isoform X2 [Bufo gargarizans]|uniref:cytochrome P450 2J5-like isoform X2 n=1 Tax=Bufo gargarizans TaxID=30331 RepID=UPI001CF268D4|nr:cytochrome P450 2J5-like isoform X2 [Bufo gargarizans]